MLLRPLPYPVFGVRALLACLLVVPLLTGHGALVGIGWLVAGYLIMSVQVRRANRYGNDDYS